MDFLSSPVVVEQVALNIKECFVYRVPPLRSASGHRAEEWGLDKPLFTGYLRIYQADTKLRIVLYRYKDESTMLSSDENLVHFAECPICINPKEDITPFVDSVADSSRYFVIRVKDPNSDRSISLGIGFRERDTAFDFKNTLNEYVRYIDRMSAAEQMHKEVEELSLEDEENAADTGPVKCMRDLSVKEGEKIHVNVKTLGTRREKTNKSGGGLRGLKPPPPPGSIVKAHDPSDVTTANLDGESPTTDSTDDTEWGDFTS